MSTGAARPSLLDELCQRSLADIARELESLRNDNARLKDEVARIEVLQPENNRLKQEIEGFEQELATLKPALSRTEKENLTFRGAVKFLIREGGYLLPTMRTRASPASFPPEVLLRIFRATMPSLYELDPSIMRLCSPWPSEMRFRKGLILVCKAWSGPGTAALYEDIVFRDMGQILALARTLSSNGGRALTALIQHIRMDDCVVWAPFSDIVKGDLTYILKQCVALRSFTFHPHPNFPNVRHPEEGDAWEGFNPTWFVQDCTSDIGQALKHRLSSGLLELDISMTLAEKQMAEVVGLLRSATLLTSLKLGPVSVGGGFEAALPKLSFPALKELQFSVCHHAFTKFLCSSAMAHLTHLTMLDCETLPLEVLEAHGKHLTYLHIFPHKRERMYDYSYNPCTTTHLDELPRLCPILEHLVFPTEKFNHSSLVVIAGLASTTLRYLDMWCHDCRATPESIEDELKEARHTLPSLERIRHLRKVIRPELPLALHPTLLSGDEVRIRRFPGFYFAQAPWVVVPDSGNQSDVPWFVHLPPDDAWSDTESDEDEMPGRDNGQDENGDEDGDEGEVKDEGQERDEDEDKNVGEQVSDAPDEASEDSWDSEDDYTSSEGSEEEEEEDSDTDIDAEISDGEFDAVAMRETLLSQRYDRDMVLDIFQAIRERNNNLGDVGEGQERM